MYNYKVHAILMNGNKKNTMYTYTKCVNPTVIQHKYLWSTKDLISVQLHVHTNYSGMHKCVSNICYFHRCWNRNNNSTPQVVPNNILLYIVLQLFLSPFFIMLYMYFMY